MLSVMIILQVRMKVTTMKNNSDTEMGKFTLNGRYSQAAVLQVASLH